MDNLFSWILIILLNMDFLCGIPELNSFLPFEMEEDLLFALGYRLHGRQQGGSNHWFDNFEGNTNMHIFHPRQSTNMHDTFHQRQSVFDQWLQGKITTDRNNENTFTTETTTVKQLQNNDYIIKTSKKDSLNTKQKSKIIANNDKYTSIDINRQSFKPVVDFNVDNVGSSFGFSVSHNIGASKITSPLQNTEENIAAHSSTNFNVNNVGKKAISVNPGTSSNSNSITSASSLNGVSLVTNKTMTHSKSISKDISSTEKLVSNAASVTSDVELILKDNVSPNRRLANTSSVTSNVKLVSKDISSPKKRVASTTSVTGNVGSILKDISSSKKRIANTGSVTKSISKDMSSTEKLVSNTAVVTSDVELILKDILSPYKRVANRASVTNNVELVSKDISSAKKRVASTTSVTGNVGLILKDISSAKKRKANTGSVTKSISKDISSTEKLVSNAASVTSDVELILKESLSPNKRVANTASVTSSVELVSKDMSSVKKRVPSTRSVTGNVGLISKDISSAKKRIANTGSVTKSISKDISSTEKLVSNAASVTSDVELILKDILSPYKRVANRASVTNNVELVSKDISSAKKRVASTTSVTGNVGLISKDISSAKKRRANTASVTKSISKDISSTEKLASNAASVTSDVELILKDILSPNKRVANTASVTSSVKLVANPTSNRHNSQTVMSNTPLTVGTSSLYEATTIEPLTGIIPFTLRKNVSKETPTDTLSYVTSTHTPSTSKSISGFRDDLKQVFKDGVTSSANDGTFDVQISKITKEYKPATVEFRPLTEIYQTVTMGFNRKLDSNNPDKTYSVIKPGTRGKISNVQNDPPSRSFLLSGKNFNRFDKNIETLIIQPTTLWPFFNGVTTRPRDISFESSVVIPLQQSFVSRPELPKHTSTVQPTGIPIIQPFISSDSATVQPKTEQFSRGEVNTPLTSISAKGACNGCKMENGAGYNSHPTDCDKYVQCYFDKNNLVTAFYRNCPWGQFWNQEILSCQPPQNVKCVKDPCYKSSVGSYSDKSSCRSYWTCQSRYSVPKCCPKGHRYQPNVGCVEDYSCRDVCQLKSEDVNTGCDKRGVPNRPADFEQYVEGHGWVHMECASGTRYNPSECSCSLRTQRTAIPDKCNSLMHLEFIENVKDISGNDVFVQNENVEIKNGYAHFNGSSRLVIPQFTNAELGNNFGFRIRFKEEKGIPRHMLKQSLINNGDCGDLGSVRLTFDEDNVVFGIETEDNKEAVSFHIRKPLADWTEVVYYFSDNMLDGWVNGETNSRLATGTIEKRKCALQIGHGEGFSNFIGFIDEVQLFRCDTGALDQPTSIIPEKGNTLPSPPLSTIPQTFVTSTPKQNPTGSIEGVFITMRHEIITPPPPTTGAHSNDRVLLVKPAQKYTPTKTTFLFTPEAVTLPPIIPQSLPPVIVPVTFPDITTPSVLHQNTRESMPQIQPAAVVQTTPPYIHDVSIDYGATMPPIKPAITPQYIEDTLPPLKLRTRFSWADLQQTNALPTHTMPSRSTTAGTTLTSKSNLSGWITKSYTLGSTTTTPRTTVAEIATPKTGAFTTPRSSTTDLISTTSITDFRSSVTTDNGLFTITATRPPTFTSTTPPWESKISDVTTTNDPPQRTSTVTTALPTINHANADILPKQATKGPQITITPNAMKTITPASQMTRDVTTSEKSTPVNTATDRVLSTSTTDLPFWTNEITTDLLASTANITTYFPVSTAKTTTYLPVSSTEITTDLPSSTTEITTNILTSTSRKGSPTKLPSTIRKVLTTVLPHRKSAPDPA